MAEIESSVAQSSPTWHLYLIECIDGSYYTGITTNVERRFAQHINGDGARYTRSHKPLRILASREVGTHSEALKAELVVKRLPKEEKIAAIATPSCISSVK
jgi:putative endonuclease